MGYTGDFVLARCDTPLERLPVLGDPARCIEELDEYLNVCRPRPGGRQTLQLGRGLPDNDDDRWLDALVAATGSPVLIASVFDSDVCLVRGRTPSGAEWSAFLDPEMAADYEIAGSPPPADDPPPGEGEKERNVCWMLAEVPGTAQEVADWAAEAGFTADREALREVLAQRADPCVEDLVFQLFDACGLPPALPEGADPVDIDPLAHPGHHPGDGSPRGSALEKAVLNLPRDGNLVLECAADEQCYAQVWHRPDGTYQLEYRDRAPAEHYLTRTVSAEKVVAALQGWTAGGAGWRDAFQWDSIGSWFTDSQGA
ncbi:hypothetical protein [Actinacidiphila glaucinigra]|uniref:Uncharacterized protein n=1 Tax=Actinacidiphila glaucinigra TaxID=235986 RepID=A0A239MGT8_9ACTN|nr:hypothetical protein [Actinacidiphila glaucinigra]SNT41891.1 hypothetical protein SAMN05216252_12488 [Actinacidiphila glaucinigra]